MPKVGRPINRYDFPQAMHQTSQHPRRRVTPASHCTTDNQPNRSTYPKTKPGLADGMAQCPDATDHRAATTLRRNAPRSTRPRAAPPRPQQHNARITLTCPVTHRPTPSRRGPHSTNPITTTTHTHSLHPKTPMQANVTLSGQAAHLQPIRSS